MLLAGAGVFLTKIAEDVLWLLIIGIILFVAFLAWLRKWENDRELRQRQQREAKGRGKKK